MVFPKKQSYDFTQFKVWDANLPIRVVDTLSAIFTGTLIIRGKGEYAGQVQQDQQGQSAQDATWRTHLEYNTGVVWDQKDDRIGERETQTMERDTSRWWSRAKQWTILWRLGG